MRIEIYGQPNCGFCKDAISLCEKHGYQHVYRDIAANLADRKEMLARAPGATKVPQIFINHRHIGGYDDLAALQKSGALQQLIAGT